MHDGVRDYLRRKSDRRRMEDSRRGRRSDRAYTGDSTYTSDHARRRHDMAMDRARSRRRRRDGELGVGHYVYEAPVPYSHYDHAYQDSAYQDHKDYADHEDEYKKDLNEWIHRLKAKDRFGLGRSEIEHKAHEMKVNFSEISEEEFYAIYLMMVSDYPHIANEPHTYIAMAKAFLDDDDIAVSPSEKVCKYLYEIVLDV